MEWDVKSWVRYESRLRWQSLGHSGGPERLRGLFHFLPTSSLKSEQFLRFVKHPVLLWKVCLARILRGGLSWCLHSVMNGDTERREVWWLAQEKKLIMRQRLRIPGSGILTQPQAPEKWGQIPTVGEGLFGFFKEYVVWGGVGVVRNKGGEKDEEKKKRRERTVLAIKHGSKHGPPHLCPFKYLTQTPRRSDDTLRGTGCRAADFRSFSSCIT